MKPLLSNHQKAGLIGTLLGVFLLVFFLIPTMRAFFEYRRAQFLLSKHDTAQAEVVSREKNGTVHTISYKFDTRGGTHRGSAEIPKDLFFSLVEGMRIPIKYAPAAPNPSIPAALVPGTPDLARAEKRQYLLRFLLFLSSGAVSLLITAVGLFLILREAESFKYWVEGTLSSEYLGAREVMLLILIVDVLLALTISWKAPL